MSSQVAAAGALGSPDDQVTWPVRAGTVPPVAAGFSPRPETAAGLGALVPGALVMLAPDRVTGAESPGWLGTCGKTQLAVFVAESLWAARELDLLAWITATSRASVLAGFAAAAAAAGTGSAGSAESVAMRFLGWLGETSRPWLVVLDGLADAADLDGLWPSGPAGRTLVTVTGSPPASGLREAKAIGVGAFSPREALSYLMGRLTADPDQRLGAIDLVEELSCEPLALAHASAVIASSSLSCRDYLDHFLRRREVIARAPGDRPPAATATWTLCVEQAERLAPGGSTHSLLAFAALFDGHQIPSAVFSSQAARGYLAAAGGAGDPELARDGLLALARAGLLTLDPAASPPAVRMNQAIAAAVRSAMPSGMFDRAVKAAADALLEVWPAEEPPGWLGEGLRSCAASVQRAGGDRLWVGRCHPLLPRAGQSLDSARLTGPAVDYWRELVAISGRMLPPGHSDALLAGERLARACLAAGRAADAVSWFQWTLNGRTLALGADHPSAAAAKVELGHALVSAGELGNAVTVLDSAVTDSARVHGPEHPNTLLARDQLANACRAAGQPADAIRLYRQTLADRERIQGPHHPDTVITRQQLAGTYLAAGRNKDAISQYKRVLSERERSVGADHPDTITARGNLAAAYHAAGRMAAGLQLYEQTRADAIRVRGADHPDTLASTTNLAHAYYAVGRLTDAAELLRDTAARCERMLPPGDPLTQAVRESLLNIGG
ncbi:MAG TPA: tetratricopeptide repeat protein [Streptosporangiaceae bacterium]|jgi:tetratricopeptide (TPR) repeat protein